MESLRGIKLFEDLPQTACDQINQDIIWKKFKQSVEVVGYKEEGNDVYFLAQGRVRAMIYSFSGKEISFQDLSAGESFGELSAIDGLPRSTNVVTLEPSVIGSISSTKFWDILLGYPQVTIATLKNLAHLVRFVSGRMYQYGALDVKGRVCVELLNLARDHTLGDNSATISDMPKHVEIASRINTHREAVTKELNKLSKMGLLEQKGRVLTITDVAKLAELLPDD